MPHRRLSAACYLLLLGTTGCSLQTSEAAELGPQRQSCAPLGHCQPCPCPGLSTPGYQVCDNRGYYVKHGTPAPGCTCPPYQLTKPAQCNDDTATAGAGGS